jgi:transposase
LLLELGKAIAPGSLCALTHFAELERLYRRTRDGALKMRSLMIRLLDKGERPREIADRLGVSPVTIWRWSQRYLLEGTAGLHTRPRKGRPPKLRPEVRELLVQAAESSPRNVGVNSSNWTLGLLAHICGAGDRH